MIKYLCDNCEEDAGSGPYMVRSHKMYRHYCSPECMMIHEMKLLTSIMMPHGLDIMQNVLTEHAENARYYREILERNEAKDNE